MKTAVQTTRPAASRAGKTFRQMSQVTPFEAWAAALPLTKQGNVECDLTITFTRQTAKTIALMLDKHQCSLRAFVEGAVENYNPDDYLTVNSIRHTQAQLRQGNRGVR